MATSPVATKIALGEDDCVVIPASWGSYLRLLADRGEKRRPRYIFLDGRLTVVSPGPFHEGYRVRLSGFIDEILVGLQMSFRPMGSVTLLKARQSREGTEADQTYYFTNIKAVRGKKKLVMGVDPPPDLAVEVVVSHSERDALEAYARFGIREAWVVKDLGLTFLELNADGSYVPTPTSISLPFLASEELASWLFREDLDDEISIRSDFRAWVAEVLVPRTGPDRD